MTSTSLDEWDERICEETTGVPGKPYARLTDRARLECKKRLRAHLAVRQPQEKLDPRIIELSTTLSPFLSTEQKPYLHYGLLVHPDSFKPCVERNNLTVGLPGTPAADLSDSDSEYKLYAMRAIKGFLLSEYGIMVTTIVPFEESTKHVVFALDDTDKLRHKKFKGWKNVTGPALQLIRDELGLGDQKANWWWCRQNGVGYICPIPDYNPPQITYVHPVMQVLTRIEALEAKVKAAKAKAKGDADADESSSSSESESDEEDSDGSESESGSEESESGSGSGSEESESDSELPR